MVKNALVYVTIALAFVGGLGWGLYLDDRAAKPQTLPASPSAIAQEQPAPAFNHQGFPSTTPSSPNMPTQALWQEYSATRQKVLNGNPELASEYNDIRNEINAQMEKMNAAMIQADPKVAPIVAKLEALRQQRMGASSMPHPQPIPAPTSLGK